MLKPFLINYFYSYRTFWSGRGNGKGELAFQFNNSLDAFKINTDFFSSHKASLLRTKRCGLLRNYVNYTSLELNICGL